MNRLGSLLLGLAAITSVAIEAHAQMDDVVLATQTCVGKKCDTRLMRAIRGGDMVEAALWRGPIQPYFTDVAEDLDGSWFVSDQGRIRTFEADLAPSHFLGSKKEIAYSSVFDAAGNSYVSVFSFGRASLRKYNSRREEVASFKTPHPVYAMDLAADQCTLYYTSDPRGEQIVRRYNVCVARPMDDWGTVVGLTVMQFRILRDEGLLVATGNELQRFNKTAFPVRSYDIGGRDHWRSVALTESGDAFWAATTNGAAMFDLGSGRVLDEIGGPAESTVGIAVRGGWRAARSTPGRPSAPSGLRVRLADNGDDLQLEWIDNATDETGFTIEYKINYGPWIELGSVGANRQIVTVSNFRHGRQYKFRVRAYNEKGVSGYSNEATIYDRKS